MANPNVAQPLIDRSLSHNEIVHADWTPELEEALLAACDDWTEANGVQEYWAGDTTDIMASSWRVHLEMPS